MHATVQVVYDLKPYDHVTPTLKALYRLPVKQRTKFKLCLLVHLLINKQAPVYLQNLLITTASAPHWASNRSASNNDLVKQSTTLKLGECSFSIAGPRVWTQLLTDLKAITDILVFKRKLESFFIFVSIPLAHASILLGHQSVVDGNINSIIVLYCIVL